MSVLIKSLTTTTGSPSVDLSLVAPANDYFNIIKNANIVYNLYMAPNESVIRRAAIVKSIRLVNTHTATVKATLYFNRPNANGQSRRRLLTPLDMSLPPNFVYVDDIEISLEPGDMIQAKVDTANVVQYLISGVERDAL